MTAPAQTPLRILFINRMAAMERGGGETFDLEMSRNLSALGCAVTFLTGIPLTGRARLGPATWWPGEPPRAITTVFLRSPYFGWFPWDKVKGGWRLRVADFKAFEWRAARWLLRRVDQFDIVQICELPNIVVFSKSAIRNPQSAIPKFVVRLTAPNYHDPAGGIPMADGIIASGTSLAKLRASGLTRAQNIPNGVDTERFRPQASGFRRAHWIPDDAIVLLYVARFQDFKNHSMLIRAFADASREQPALRLVLAGSGPLAPRIREQINAAGLGERVLLLGEVGFDALPSVYAGADIKVISSDYESFCFAAIEGMSTGLPVITTDCGWVPGLVGDTLPPIEKQWVVGDRDPASGRFADERDGARIREAPGGLVVGRNDHASFAQAILKLVRDPSRRRAIGAWNREKAVREHGWRRSAEKLLAHYHALRGGGAT